MRSARVRNPLRSTIKIQFKCHLGKLMMIKSLKSSFVKDSVCQVGTIGEGTVAFVSWRKLPAEAPAFSGTVDKPERCHVHVLLELSAEVHFLFYAMLQE